MPAIHTVTASKAASPYTITSPGGRQPKRRAHDTPTTIATPSVPFLHTAAPPEGILSCVQNFDIAAFAAAQPAVAAALAGGGPAQLYNPNMFPPVQPPPVQSPSVANVGLAPAFNAAWSGPSAMDAPPVEYPAVEQYFGGQVFDPSMFDPTIFDHVNVDPNAFAAANFNEYPAVDQIPHDPSHASHASHAWTDPSDPNNAAAVAAAIAVAPAPTARAGNKRGRSTYEAATEAAHDAQQAHVQEVEAVKKRKTRCSRTTNETMILEAIFSRQTTPSPATRRDIANAFGCPEVEIKHWFSNRIQQEGKINNIPGYNPPSASVIASNIAHTRALFRSSENITALPAYQFRMGIWARALSCDSDVVDFAIGINHDTRQLLQVVVHNLNIYRVVIPINAMNQIRTYDWGRRMGKVRGALAIRLALNTRSATYQRWDSETNAWVAHKDFTGGQNEPFRGRPRVKTQVEISGWEDDIRVAYEQLVGEFNRVQSSTATSLGPAAPETHLAPTVPEAEPAAFQMDVCVDQPTLVDPRPATGSASNQAIHPPTPTTYQAWDQYQQYGTIDDLNDLVVPDLLDDFQNPFAFDAGFPSAAISSPSLTPLVTPNTGTMPGAGSFASGVFSPGSSLQMPTFNHGSGTIDPSVFLNNNNNMYNNNVNYAHMSGCVNPMDLTMSNQ